MDLARIYRLLRLMQLMSSNVDYTTPELKELLEISERSIFRYLEVFKDAGYALQKKDKNIHKLFKMPVEFTDIKDLVYITPEEAHILHTLLMSISGDSQIHINLEQKLAALFDDTSITEIIGHKSSAENVRMLKDAMDRKKRVILTNYESNHSTSVSDRLVEPYGFSVNYSDVYAYEVPTGICKIFKICRIGWVRVTEDDWKNECEHEDITQDCFRMTGKECIPVCLKMTLKAKNLLIEEYPLSQRDLSYEDGFWYLRTIVKGLTGVGRFVIGLADQIEVINSSELENYIKEFVRKHITDCKIPYLRDMGQYYRHFKGNIYRILHIAKHSETQEDMVVYQAMYGEQGIWVRPKDMFFEKITKNGVIFDRFTPISEQEALTAIQMNEK